MDFSDAENLRGGVEYIDTVRALHQTVVSLRSALEQSRSEVLQLRTQAWPLENLESALTALSLENHLLRKKILDLNRDERDVDVDVIESPRDELACRFKSVTSSLENLTTKSQGKSSQFSSGTRTKSFHSLCGVGDHEPVFTSTPLLSNQLNNTFKESKLRQGKIPPQFQESGVEIGDKTPKEAKKTKYKKQDNEDFQIFKPNKQKETFLENVNKDSSLNTQIIDQEKIFEENNYPRVNKPEPTFLITFDELYQKNYTRKSINDQKTLVKFEEPTEKRYTRTKTPEQKSFVRFEDPPKRDKSLGFFEESKELTSKPETLDTEDSQGKDKLLGFFEESKEPTSKPKTLDSQRKDKSLGFFEESQELASKPKTLDTEESQRKDKSLGFFEKSKEPTSKPKTPDTEDPRKKDKSFGFFEENKELTSKLKTLDTEDSQRKDKSLQLSEENKGLTPRPKTSETEIVCDDPIESLENFLKNKDEGLLKLESTKFNQSESHSFSKQTDSQWHSKDKRRDKKISVSVNLEIYRKPSKIKHNFVSVSENPADFEMEPAEKNVNVNENILRHSSSTDLLDQEVDDIELIFTNEDTKETNLKEPLISIEGGNNRQPQDFDRSVSAEGELEDDVFNDNFENENQENINFQSQTFDFTRENSQIYDSKSDNSINRDDAKSFKSYYSYQDSSFENKSLEKDESFDRFDERVRIVETDISKVGIQDVEYSMGRRNTCPNPIQYRPIAHRDAISRGFNTRKTRPILAHSNASRKESGAQTDISALPNKSSWRSESSLAHKVKIGDNFATLPSKYPLPGSRLRLSEKTVEARRILLSDIGFTSMVPELSRSADHLFPPNLKTPSVTNYGQFLKTTDLHSPAYTSQRFMWTTASPSDSHSQSRYSSLYPLPSPPAPSRRCSAPVSPCRRNVLKHMPSKVRFANGSLPELRGDWNTTIDSGDSTDSLVEEAEQYLRRSIDCIVSGKDISHHGMSKTSHRRASAPEPARDNIPPQGWQPFLPRQPRDLRLDYWVKVISPEGRVRGGRVRFIGDLASHSEQYVGVQLSMPDGHSDGTYNNRRYFQCEPYHGIFVPFKKVIMGWRP